MCDDVKRIAYFFLDGALSPDRTRDVENHLRDCSECDDRISIHRRMRRFVRSRLASLPAPARLRERLRRITGRTSASPV